MGKYYDILWNTGSVSQHVWISDGAYYTWMDVQKILKEY